MLDNEVVFSSGLVPRDYEKQDYTEIIPAHWASKQSGFFTGGANWPNFGGMVGAQWLAEAGAGRDFYLAYHGTLVGYLSEPTSVFMRYPTWATAPTAAQQLLTRHNFYNPGSGGYFYRNAGVSATEYPQIYLGQNGTEFGTRHWYFCPQGAELNVTGGGAAIAINGVFIRGALAGNLSLLGAFTLNRWDAHYRYGYTSFAPSTVRAIDYVYCRLYGNAENNAVVGSNFPANNLPLLFSTFVPRLQSNSNTLGAHYFTGQLYRANISQQYGTGNLITLSGT